MPAKLTNQDKLALALTSAGSMRNLGALVGVTHQKIGRWLRGDTAIPTEATQAIETAFAIHSEVARDQAAVEGLPFDPEVPLFVTRPDVYRTVPVVVGVKPDGSPIVRMRKKAFPGQRAIVSKTDYIDISLIANAVETMIASPIFGSVSARSIIKASRAIKERQSGFEKLKAQLSEGSLRPDDPVRRYTIYSNKTRLTGPADVAEDLFNKLDSREQDAYVTADTVVFFLPRFDGEQPITRKKRRRR